MRNVKLLWMLLSLVALIAVGQITCAESAKADDYPDETCPKCESEKTIPIIYGYPSPELWDAVNKGEVMLGG
jgi:hypothetical protein